MERNGDATFVTKDEVTLSHFKVLTQVKLKNSNCYLVTTYFYDYVVCPLLSL